MDSHEEDRILLENFLDLGNDCLGEIERARFLALRRILKDLRSGGGKFAFTGAIAVGAYARWHRLSVVEPIVVDYDFSDHGIAAMHDWETNADTGPETRVRAWRGLRLDRPTLCRSDPGLRIDLYRGGLSNGDASRVEASALVVEWRSVATQGSLDTIILPVPALPQLFLLNLLEFPGCERSDCISLTLSEEFSVADVLSEASQFQDPARIDAGVSRLESEFDDLSVRWSAIHEVGFSSTMREKATEEIRAIRSGLDGKP
jgi:hypothetical protein